VINTMPSTSQTFHFIDSERLKVFKQGSIFFNIGRGASVHTEALIHAIKSGKFSHVFLDVFEEEPLNQGFLSFN